MQFGTNVLQSVRFRRDQVVDVDEAMVQTAFTFFTICIRKLKPWIRQIALKGKLINWRGKQRVIIEFILNKNPCPFARFDVIQRIPLDERAIMVSTAALKRSKPMKFN